MISLRSAANRGSGRTEVLGRFAARHSEMRLGTDTGGLITATAWLCRSITASAPAATRSKRAENSLAASVAVTLII